MITLVCRFATLSALATDVLFNSAASLIFSNLMNNLEASSGYVAAVG